MALSQPLPPTVSPLSSLASSAGLVIAPEPSSTNSKKTFAWWRSNGGFSLGGVWRNRFQLEPKGREQSFCVFQLSAVNLAG